MIRGSSCCVGLLLACGGAVDSSAAPVPDGAALPQLTAPSDLSGALGSGGGWSEPATPSDPADPPPPSLQPPARESVNLPDGTIAAAQAWPVAVALDATHVYWANWGGYLEGGILRAPKRGGDAEVLVRSSNRPDTLALDGAYAYFAERVLGTLSRVPLSKGVPAQIVGGVSDLGWVLSDQVVYFQGNSSEGIQAIGKQGGDTQTTVPAAKASGPLQLHAGYVYWREHFFPDASSFDDPAQRIWRAPTQGGQPEMLVTEPNTVLTSMAVADEAIYYGLSGALPECGCEGGLLKAVANGSTIPLTLVTVQGLQINAIAVDPANVYWATSSAIYRTSKDDVVTVTLASDLPSVSALALDEEHLYFGTYEESGSVRRIRK
jgi:hypothetical protein